MVTGYDEALAVYTDTDTFSSCNSVTGPFPGFPVPLEGDDVSELIEQHRDELPFSDQITTMDPPKHRDHRHLLMRLLTPKRLKENEEFMWRLADRQIDEFIARGECELIGDYANPFTLLVIADLLGVPEEDHEEFRDALARPAHATGAVGSTEGRDVAQPARVALRPVQPRTSRTAGASRATTCSPRWRPRRSRTARCPRSSTSSASPPTSSPPGRRRPCGCSARRCSSSASDPDLQQLLREQPRPHPELRRGDAAHRAPGEGRLPARPRDGDGRRGRRSPPARR